MDQNWKTILLRLLLMLHYLKCTGKATYKNSAINYTVTGDIITLTCKYTRNGTVESVSWYNSTTDVPLTIQAESCIPVSLEKSSFDPSRIQKNYTCISNIYTLSFKLVPTTDYNRTMACTFSDPDPGEPKDNITIKEKGIVSDEEGGGGGWRITAIVLIVLLVSVAIVAIAFAYYRCKGKSVSGKKKVSEPEYSYHVAKGTAGQESLKPECGEYKDLHKDEN